MNDEQDSITRAVFRLEEMDLRQSPLCEPQRPVELGADGRNYPFPIRHVLREHGEPKGRERRFATYISRQSTFERLSEKLVTLAEEANRLAQRDGVNGAGRAKQDGLIEVVGLLEVESKQPTLHR